MTDVSTKIKGVNQLVQGWLQCGQLSTAHTLQAFQDKPVKVVGVFDFGLGNSANAPAVGFEIFRFAGVFSGVGVPIGSIDFKGNTYVPQQKVNTVATNLGLLGVLNTSSIKSLANLCFKQIFAAKLTVARNTAKLPICVTWKSPELFAAGTTGHSDGRASAFLRAVMPVQPFFSNERFPATFADGVLRFSNAASMGTNSVSCGIRGGYLEFLAASWANFSDHLGRPTRVVALPAAILSLLDKLSAGNGASALDTGRWLRSAGGIVARLATVFFAMPLHIEGRAAVGTGSSFHIPPQGDKRLLIELYHNQSTDVIDSHATRVER